MSFPLTEAQRKFWNGHQLWPDQPIYNMAWRFDLHGEIDPELFQSAFYEALKRDEVFRTVFRHTPDGPVQTVESVQLDVLEIVDLSHEPETVLADNTDSWVQTPFDLTRNTLRSKLVKLATDRWVWLVCQHHIVCDAQSGALFFEQVSQNYAALRDTGYYDPEPIPSFFARDIEFDANTANPLLQTPSPSSPPYGSDSQRTSKSQRVHIPISEQTRNALEEVVTRPEFRLFTPDLSRIALYLTAYLAYLHRITGDETITIGLPSHNRLTDQDRKTPGPYVEVLPFSVTIDTSDTLKYLHTKVRQSIGTFLKSAKPGAVANTNTADITAVCNYIQARFGDFAGFPARVQWLHSGAHDAAHAMRLHITDFTGDGQHSVFMDVADEVLDAVHQDRVASHFTQFLTTVITAPDTLVSTVDFAASEDDRSVVYGPQEAPDIPLTILDAFAACVHDEPNAVAMWQNSDHMTYGDLNAWSDAIAARVVDIGIPAGSRIAVHLPRSFDFVAVVLGILKAGCSFVPLATNTPKARVDQILGNCDAAAVFVPAGNAQTFPCPTLTTEVDTTAAFKQKRQIRPDDLAYVLYTSGSTGIPKGVAVNHKNLSRYVHWAAQEFSPNQPAHYAFFSSIAFDLTLTSVFAPLVSGGSIRAYPEKTDPDLSVLDVFAEDNVDIVKLTPSHLALVIKQGQPCRRIKTLVLGGENLTSQLCNRAQQVLSPSLRLINEYGPTEAVVGAMQHSFDPTKDQDLSVQIGNPAAGMVISLRDPAMNICPKGVVGEITISGRLADGYLGAVASDNAAFLEDPENATERVYRTGDLGRMHHNGRFEYLGRADQQVKVGGVRLELSEIENTLQKLPGVEGVHILQGSKQKDAQPTQHCKQCGLTNEVPGITFSDPGLCHICAEFKNYENRAKAYFRPEPELERKIAEASTKSAGNYDAVMMLSGGKDSTYAAYRLADHTSRVLAVTLDNGYISGEAKANIKRVVEDLGWEHRYLSTDKMNHIFVDSLKAHSNVCQGCFKALYTLAFRTALSEGAPLLVTGLSRGQFFETRLTPDLFRNNAPTCAQLDDMVTQARKAYHAEDDALSRLLKTDDLKDGGFLSKVEVLDIYRYIDVPVSEIYDFLNTKTAWQRPSDTGRSTNCLINDAGIYLHKAREGFHNYALPYSWDVRMGHKTREQAVEELNDDIDSQKVERILNEIGFDEAVLPRPKLSVFVQGTDLSAQEIWDTLRAQFPREMLPHEVVILDDLPLTSNGKIDTARLPVGTGAGPSTNDYVAPSSETEVKLSQIVCGVLGIGRISASQEFFDLGVDSIAAIEIAMKANEEGLALPATALFEYRTLKALAKFADELPDEQRSVPDHMPLVDLDSSELSAISEALN